MNNLGPPAQTVQIKHLLDLKHVEDDFVFLTRKSIYFCEFLISMKCANHLYREATNENKQKNGYLILTGSDKAFKNTIVNRTLLS